MKVSKYKVYDSRVNAETGCVQVKIENQSGEAFGPEVIDNANEIVEKSDINYKVLKAASDSESYVKATVSSAVLAGSSIHRVASTEKFGNFVVGPTVFTSHPEEIRFGGIYRLNGMHTSTMASTIITPMPLFKIDIPGVELLNVLKSIKERYDKIITEAAA